MIEVISIRVASSKWPRSAYLIIRTIQLVFSVGTVFFSQFSKPNRAIQCNANLQSALTYSGLRWTTEEKRKEWGGSFGCRKKTSEMEETCVWMAEVGLSWEPKNWAGPHGGIYITISLIGLSFETWADGHGQQSCLPPRSYCRTARRRSCVYNDCSKGFFSTVSRILSYSSNPVTA